MLRVITLQDGKSYRLELSGMLGGEWVPVLEQLWRSIVDDVPSAKVTVVVSDVDFIDLSGEQLLQRMADGEVQFVVSGCMNRYVIEKLTACQRSKRSPAGKGFVDDIEENQRIAAK